MLTRRQAMIAAVAAVAAVALVVGGVALLPQAPSPPVEFIKDQTGCWIYTFYVVPGSPVSDSFCNVALRIGPGGGNLSVTDIAINREGTGDYDYFINATTVNSQCWVAVAYPRHFGFPYQPPKGSATYAIQLFEPAVYTVGKVIPVVVAFNSGYRLSTNVTVLSHSAPVGTSSQCP